MKCGTERKGKIACVYMRETKSTARKHTETHSSLNLLQLLVRADTTTAAVLSSTQKVSARVHWCSRVSTFFWLRIPLWRGAFCSFVEWEREGKEERGREREKARERERREKREREREREGERERERERERLG